MGYEMKIMQIITEGSLDFDTDRTRSYFSSPKELYQISLTCSALSE